MCVAAVRFAAGALVVVPASVLANWQGELSRFAPDLRVVVYHGTPDVRGSAKGAIRKSRRAGGDHVDVVVTT
mgnify:CR=1 FL=1